MTDKLIAYYNYLDKRFGTAVEFKDGRFATYSNEGDIAVARFTYSSALNLASKLLQWATNLPESEKGNIHKIDGEWVDVDGHSED